MSDQELPSVDINYETEDCNQVVEEKNKYTEIDHLDEDDIIQNQRFVCLSFISPEGVMNTNLRSVKVRGVFATHEEANAHCEKLQKQDKYFDVFVGECGKWLPWDPDPNSVDDIKYKNKKLSEVMDKQKESEMKKLNELAGRHKENIDKKKKDHERRKADKIVSGNKENDGINIKNESNVTVKPTKKSNNRQEKLEKIRERMRTKLKARKTSDETSNSESTIKTLEENLKVQQNKVDSTKKEIDENNEAISSIENNINKMKEYISK